MKAVILAGGFGTRLSEETHLRPKPMVEIGGMPIIWHIMKIYASHGINDFIICAGYKGHFIKEYFSNYFMHSNDLTIDLSKNKITYHKKATENWTVTIVDTGLESMTGERLKRVSDYIGPDEPFCFTYGDGVSDIDISLLVQFHHEHGKLATVSAVKPDGRYGALELKGHSVEAFVEKPAGDGSWINGGFFVLQPEVLKYLEGDNLTWEQEPLMSLARNGQLSAYKHRGFWQAMDTLRDKNVLEKLWDDGLAPWKVW